MTRRGTITARFGATMSPEESQRMDQILTRVNGDDTGSAAAPESSEPTGPR